MRLGAGLYFNHAGPLLLDLARAQGVTFSTNERGFASFSCTIALPLLDSFYIYDRATLPHLAVYWAGGVVWEGRLEDVAIIPGGLRLTALGYIRGYADAPYSTSHIGVTASTIVNALIASVSTLNSFMSASTMLVQNPGVTLAEIYEDQLPIDILDRLCNLGDSQTTPRLWEAGVWENRMLHFRPRGDAARKWAIDVAAPEIERTLETLYNSVYAVYQDGGNQRAVTATSADATSVARYGLTRRAAIGLQAIDATLAGKVRDAYLQDHKDPPVRADVGFNRLYDQFGTPWPAYAARSGDQITIRNLPPTASSDIDRIRTFRLKETMYDADADWMTVVPESLRAGLAPQDNATRLNSVTDPNFQYAPRPLLSELYANFLGLPALRGYWPMSSAPESGNAIDLSGQDRTMTYTGNPTYQHFNDLVPFIKFDGTGDVLTRADEAGLDIIGTETTIVTANRGVTIGGWFWIDTLGVQQGLIGKSNGTSNAGSAYHLFMVASNQFYFQVINAAASASFAATQAATVVVDAWNFVVGRYTPSTEVALFSNGVKDVLTTSIPASLNNNATAFNIGGAAGGQLLDGRAASCFLCAAALTDTQIQHLFERTRRFFGA